MTEAENQVSDAEYLLSLIDETFANVPQIKAHHDRMRKIAATLCRHEVPSKEATPIHAALAELVACEDLKDARMECRTCAEEDALRAQYYQRQPLAWEAARAALAGPAVVGDDTPGSPKNRLNYLLDELEKRFQDPEPFSASLPEVRYLAMLDAALAGAAVAVHAEPVEWKTPPASWRLLLKAVIELLCAVDDRHDSAAYPMKYSVPYGAVNNLRASLGLVSPTAANVQKYLLPDDLYPDSKDWMAGCYAERVGWLHSMYESSKKLIASLESQLLLSQRSLLYVAREPGGEFHGLDSAEQVCFYEQDFYVLSNFSSFRVKWRGIDFDTSEHAYHYEKFFPTVLSIAHEIQYAKSAHEAFKIAEENRGCRRDDWDDVKIGIMRGILRAKAGQHEYVCRKLLATGDRNLIENSWRDDLWGWGPNRDGKNMLGKLWMEIRAELRATPAAPKEVR